MSWITSNDRLEKHFEFSDFKQAFSFMTQLALYAEASQHHPTWTNTYNQVDIILTTHDAGNTVTDKDRAFADFADQCYEQYE